MNRLGKMLGGVLIAALLIQSATAGRLGKLEKKAGKKSSSSKATSTSAAEAAPPAKAEARGYDSASTSSFGSGTYPSSGVGESFLTAMFGWLATSAFSPDYDDLDAEGGYEEDGWATPESLLFPSHDLGKMTMPYLRADFNWQYLDDDLDARDLRVEAGYKMIGFHGRHTLYMDHLPDADPEELSINQYYGVLRFCFPPRGEPNALGLEVGLGAGVAQQIGNEEHSSWALTVPVKYHFNDVLGLEFRPAWYRWSELMVGDYDASVSLGWRFFQGRVGYRWLWMQSEGHMLNGPYGGISVAF